MEGDALKKTFCDNCGNQCRNVIVNIVLGIVHQTQDGQNVGEDYCKPMEVCKDCGDKLEALMPKLFILQDRHQEEMPERVAVYTDHSPIPERPIR